MSTGRRLYRAVSRIIRRYDAERIPLRGAMGQQEVCIDHAWCPSEDCFHCVLNSLLIHMLRLISQWIAPTEDNITYLQTIFRTAPPLKAANIDGKAPKWMPSCSMSLYTLYHSVKIRKLCSSAETTRVIRQLQARLGVLQGADSTARAVCVKRC
jgi:hypothetical protein